MTLDALIILIGTFVAVLPFLGFPNSWDRVLFLIAGIIVIVLGLIVRRRSALPEHPEMSAYLESAPRVEGDHEV